ncbi:hypothetical protein ACFX1X_022787 [Malus domestica]
MVGSVQSSAWIMSRKPIFVQSLVYSDGDGRIIENEATKFFAMPKLSREELKQVWAIADMKRQGFLGLSTLCFPLLCNFSSFLPRSLQGGEITVTADTDATQQ